MQSECMFEFLPYPLRIVAIFACLLSVVPISGFLAFGGNLKATWAYTKRWFLVVGGMVVLASILAGFFWLILPAPP